MASAPWSLVLAAGSGRRLSGLTGGVPKQFWSPTGGRTLIEDTIARFEPFAPEARRVVVIDRSQQAYADAVGQRVPLGRVLAQPMDRGTAAGVLLGLVEAPDDAVVLLTPSDHGVANADAYRRGIRVAVREIRAGRRDVVLFGVRPASPAGDYGWIVPAAADAAVDCVHGVRAFIEKPDAEIASELFAAGAAWSTMVMAARASALLGLYRRHLPALARVFEAARTFGRPHERAEFLATQYPTLPPADFSRDLVTPASGLHVYLWPASLGWTDLGTPERLREWLGRAAAPCPASASPRRAPAPVLRFSPPAPAA